MNNFFQELKNAWNKADNALIQLIYINIAVFAFLVIVNLISTLTGATFLGEFIHNQFSIPPRLIDFVLRPWTAITYAFAHNLRYIWHIVFNMLFLYWFGRFIVEYLGNNKLISLYVLGALSGAVLYLIAFNLIGYYAQQSSSFPGMVGASGAVYAIVVGAATLLPNHSIHLMFLGPVKIKYIAIFYIVLSLMGATGSNSGGNIAHLGGALIGYVYIIQLKKGNDLGSWVIGIGKFLRSFFIKTDPIKVSHRNKDKARKKEAVVQDADVLPNQDEIDAILDKIAASGYDSLTKAEKQKLFNASKK